jgi:hypothetical protein
LAQLLRLVLEVLDGRRVVRQLAGLASPSVLRYLAATATDRVWDNTEHHKRHPRTNLARLLAVLATVVLAATACGGGGGGAGGGGGGGGGSLAAIDLSEATFTVGSKEFTEQLVLGQITVQALDATGADVGELATITGTTNVRTALTVGEIDMYWEYTGTGWTNHLQHETSEAPQGSEALYQAVAAADLQKNQSCGLSPRRSTTPTPSPPPRAAASSSGSPT